MSMPMRERVAHALWRTSIDDPDADAKGYHGAIAYWLPFADAAVSAMKLTDLEWNDLEGEARSIWVGWCERTNAPIDKDITEQEAIEAIAFAILCVRGPSDKEEVKL